jgi:hypothetical protein
VKNYDDTKSDRGHHHFSRLVLRRPAVTAQDKILLAEKNVVRERLRLFGTG